MENKNRYWFVTHGRYLHSANKRVEKILPPAHFFLRGLLVRLAESSTACEIPPALSLTAFSIPCSGIPFLW